MLPRCGRAALIAAAGSEIPVPCFWHTERVVRKATAFRGGANKTAPPCFPKTVNSNLATVPGEQLQRECLTENPALRENGLQRPAKGGSTPAFACGSYHKLLFFRSFIASSKKLRANISHCSQLYSITNSFLTSFQIP